MMRDGLLILDFLVGMRSVRIVARVSAVCLLLAAISLGLVQGGHLSEGTRGGMLIARLSSMVGLSAERIRINGLNKQNAKTVLDGIGVSAGGSLIGFDPEDAEQRLLKLDWVAKADVRRIFPNQLEIDVVEREPFAIWQRQGQYFLIDRFGVVMRADPKPYAGKLLLVSGEGAEKTVQELVNHLESNPVLKSRLVAASRIGERRWNLYFPKGVKAQLPENGVEEALIKLGQLESELAILDKPISMIDLRLPDRIVVTPAGAPVEVPLDPGPG
jgi:cell division protein FtsQ